jgi:hypothetical protein
MGVADMTVTPVQIGLDPDVIGAGAARRNIARPVGVAAHARWTG